MFDLITGKVPRPFHDRNTVPTLVSIAGHFFIVMAVVVIPVLYVTDQLPEVPVVMAFVTAPPAAPPPPPPPPPPVSAAAAAIPPQPPPNPLAAPIEAPAVITPENEANPSAEGVLGGVEGGVPGGVVGGIVGGLALAPPPPPPPPPPQPAAPIRIGGQVKAPALIHRVQPVYPDIAVAAHVAGDVVLEATVDAEGQVESVRVLQSRSHLLDKAAIEAVKQWRYSPLILNDTAWPFILTVTLTFSIQG